MTAAQIQELVRKEGEGMKITIEANPKEIADLVREIQDRPSEIVAPIELISQAFSETLTQTLSKEPERRGRAFLKP